MALTRCRRKLGGAVTHSVRIDAALPLRHIAQLAVRLAAEVGDFNPFPTVSNLMLFVD
ncbi:MAG: hypothetical protein R3C01_15940 [Planctomycetaceae bacterium]